MVRPRIVWQSLLLFSLFIGCAEEPGGATVKGRVTYKGQPVTEGTISFVPQGMPNVWGNLQTDGSFTLLNNMKTERIEPGTYTAFLVVLQHDLIPESGGPPKPPPIPTAVMSQATSPLVYEVVDGPNEFEIDLDELPSKLKAGVK